jgi:hypothetical protein
LTAEADSEWILTSLFGLTVARSQQWVKYETDCVSIYWATAWINTSGIPGYTFKNMITIASQKWSGWGPLATLKVNFSPPASQVNVKESTGFYLGISINGYGVSGRWHQGQPTGISTQPTFSTRHQEQQH